MDKITCSAASTIPCLKSCEYSFLADFLRLALAHEFERPLSRELAYCIILECHKIHVHFTKEATTEDVAARRKANVKQRLQCLELEALGIRIIVALFGRIL